MKLLALLLFSIQAFASAETIWVGKTDSAISCDKKKGIALEVAAKELTKMGIKILAKQKIHDDNPRIQMCGISKGDMNGYLVNKSDSEKALAIGFSVLNPQPKTPTANYK